jgi:hypothetical protein
MLSHDADGADKVLQPKDPLAAVPYPTVLSRVERLGERGLGGLRHADEPCLDLDLQVDRAHTCLHTIITQ